MLPRNASTRQQLLAVIDDLADRCLAVVGDYMLDEYCFGEVERISPEAPVPVVSVHHETVLPGGAGNVARNLCALGVRPICCGFVGEDEAARLLRHDLAGSGADVSGLITVPEMTTTRKTRILARSQQVVRVDRDNATPPSEAHQAELIGVVRERLGSCEAMLLSDYNKRVLSGPVTSSLIPAARAAGIAVVADPKPRNIPLFRGCTLVCPNAAEAHLATGIPCDTAEGLRAAAGKLLADLALDAAIITRGAQGMYLLTAEGDEGHLETAATQVSDVTGAGDTVVAVLTAALSAGHSYRAAAMLANVAAAHVVQHLGCAVVEADELRELVASSCR